MSDPSSAVNLQASILDRLRGQLIVSCQAYPGEPLRGSIHMVAIALSVLAGGAAGVRLEGLDDIRAVRAATPAPIIGLWKVGDNGVYITPTLSAAEEVARAGADVVALDGTGRSRPDGLTLAETIQRLKATSPVLVMADVSTAEEGIAAAEAGADIVSTTLAGYTPYSRPGPAPDLQLITELAGAVTVPVFAEGRIATPDVAAAALQLGATAVVVGSAITHPQSITARFVHSTSVVTPTEDNIRV
ncbi:N-acetylmannosamine-6-phosphate 2-epimerase [Arthrobacter sp. H5]|uniref:N-acetylmannosamine-6-phosphate 2-epimerase n=1 Tax=Arthrobacter sp. H5 TaxID=1267973 RepID=UPI00068871A2|nr:N-acetylmannosamine-6-phosphate 2-epimerase [Arthrobacter sp. H5]